MLALVPLGSILVVMSGDPTCGEVCFHRFADRRFVLGIPNFADVVSNLPFLLVGLAGFLFWRRRPPEKAPISWLAFVIGVGLVSVGSAFYHLDPDNASLVWDRLPMTIAFMALSVAMLSEVIDPRFDRWLLAPALVLGASSVFFWYYGQDVRPYYSVQVVPLVISPTLLVLYPKKCRHPALLLTALGFYIAAKLFESFDGAVYDATQGFVSGHTMKHFSAAIACGSLVLMLGRRSGVRSAHGTRSAAQRGQAAASPAAICP